MLFIKLRITYALICTIVGIGLMVCCGACKKQSPIIGCTDKAAVNYNGSGSCYYSGSAVFYVDVAIPSFSSIAISLNGQSQGQTILYSYPNGIPSYGTVGCASFWENWTDSSTKTVQFNVTAQGSLVSGPWAGGSVTFKGNQSNPVLLPAGGITFYTNDTTYVNGNGLKDIVVDVNTCGCWIGITQNYSIAPNYLANGCASFMLPLGNYNYSAHTGGYYTVNKSWTGSFSITNDKQYIAIPLQ